MNETRHAESFRDLIVYQKARDVALTVHKAVTMFPAEERYALADQIRRSSRSIGAQIAEAWAKRRYPKHFISKLTDADGEQQETQHWVDLARELGYLNAGQHEQILQDLMQIGKMLNAMMRKATSFCGSDPGLMKEKRSLYISHAATNNDALNVTAQNQSPITDN